MAPLKEKITSLPQPFCCPCYDLRLREMAKTFPSQKHDALIRNLFTIRCSFDDAFAHTSMTHESLHSEKEIWKLRGT